MLFSNRTPLSTTEQATSPPPAKRARHRVRRRRKVDEGDATRKAALYSAHAARIRRSSLSMLEGLLATSSYVDVYLLIQAHAELCKEYTPAEAEAKSEAIIQLLLQHDEVVTMQKTTRRARVRYLMYMSNFMQLLGAHDEYLSIKLAMLRTSQCIDHNKWMRLGSECLAYGEHTIAVRALERAETLMRGDPAIDQGAIARLELALFSARSTLDAKAL